MPNLTPDQEREIVETLKNLGWQHDLDAISIDTLRQKCPGISSEEGEKILSNLMQRGLLRPEIERGGELAVSRLIPEAKSRWI